LYPETDLQAAYRQYELSRIKWSGPEYPEPVVFTPEEESAYVGYELSRFFRTAPESYEKAVYPVGLSR